MTSFLDALSVGSTYSSGQTKFVNDFCVQAPIIWAWCAATSASCCMVKAGVYRYGVHLSADTAVSRESSLLGGEGELHTDGGVHPVDSSTASQSGRVRVLGGEEKFF